LGFSNKFESKEGDTVKKYYPFSSKIKFKKFKILNEIMVSIYFDKNGFMKKNILDYNNDSQVIRKYYKSGREKSIYAMRFGRKNGFYSFYYDTNEVFQKLKESGTYKNGRLEGRVYMYSYSKNNDGYINIDTFYYCDYKRGKVNGILYERLGGNFVKSFFVKNKLIFEYNYYLKYQKGTWYFNKRRAEKFGITLEEIKGKLKINELIFNNAL